MGRSITTLLLCLLLAVPAVAAKTSVEGMKKLLPDWPPAGWQLTPPGSASPYPPYINEGEFSGTLYRRGDGGKLWSAHVSITDQQTAEQALRMLNNFPFCEAITYAGFSARNCETAGEELGRRRLAYASGRYLVEISVIGPKPLELPDLAMK